MKILFRIVLTLIVLAVIVCGVGIWYIAPDKKLDLRYQDIDVKAKAVEMLKTQKPEITLSGSELNELAKKELLKHLGDIPQQITVTGAEFHFSGQEVTTDINGKWNGMIPFGAELTFFMEASGSVLELHHESTRIKSLRIPSAQLGLGSIEVHLKDHLPEMLTVDQIQFLQEGVKLTFKVDWMSLPSLLLK
ncbi:hypothetical protein [Paenibacillus azoreducens]|uniref:DUF2140 family protein n=1 Tax=Paenibacillus azoreducens TaxID=116718 RepID=A0A919YCT8_9BACL|nr:hypothetical protein [Paenibacillus azoreducens]GIO48346.1 hypothetical protein J34TS1_31110 [Paenibacillus azoreducens]